MKPMGVLSMTLALLVAAQTKVISEQTQAGRQQQEQQDGFIILETTIRVYPTYRNPSATSTTATTSPCVLIALFLFFCFSYFFLPSSLFIPIHSGGGALAAGTNESLSLVIEGGRKKNQKKTGKTRKFSISKLPHGPVIGRLFCEITRHSTGKLWTRDEPWSQGLFAAERADQLRSAKLKEKMEIIKGRRNNMYTSLELEFKWRGEGGNVPDDGPNEFIASQSAAFFGAEEPHVEEPLHVAHYASSYCLGKK